jgi:hypothetical protein
VVEPQITKLKAVGTSAGAPLLIVWDCDENPPGPQLKLKVTGRGGPLSFTGLSLTGQQVVTAPTAGVYSVTLTAGLDLAGLHREVKKSLNVFVA